jgi:hypothetical protein
VSHVTDLMSSGEFAARTRLGRKALRLYQEVGLLEPAEDEPICDITFVYATK